MSILHIDQIVSNNNKKKKKIQYNIVKHGKWNICCTIEEISIIIVLYIVRVNWSLEVGTYYRLLESSKLCNSILFARFLSSTLLYIHIHNNSTIIYNNELITDGILDATVSYSIIYSGLIIMSKHTIICALHNISIIFILHILLLIWSTHNSID